MAHREFQFVDETSAKFWRIEWEGDSYTVHFGRIGTQGQSQTKKLASAKDVNAFCEKAIAEKLKKGYVETTSSAGTSEATVVDETPRMSLPDILEMPPSGQFSSATPDTPILIAALQLLETPAEALAKFPTHPDDLAWSFADALVDAPPAIVTDWRFSATDVLNDVWQRIYPFKIKGMVEEGDEDTGLPKKIFLQAGRTGARFRIRIKGKDPSLHSILFALEQILPADVRIFSVLPYEETDTYLHAVHSRAIWLRVHELLGPWFWKVFTRHKSPLAFTRVGGDVKPKRNLVEKGLRGCKEWLNSAQEWVEESRRTIIGILERKIDDPELRPSYAGGSVPEKMRKRDLENWLREMATPSRLRFISADMERLGYRFVTDGAVQVGQLKSNGWQIVQLGLRYQFWALRLKLRLQANRIVDDLVDHGGRLIALAWALGDLNVVDWLSHGLLNNPTHFNGWQHTPLEPFLLQLFALWKGIEVNWSNYPKAKLGVYQQIFEAWHDCEKLAGALDICCDYHLMRTGESGFQEFSWGPYDIFPVEVLAVYRVRELMNLKTPTISHQLMDSPLGKLPAPVQSEPDELLRRVMGVVQSELPELWTEMAQH